MAGNTSIHIDLSVFRQMPDYADDAYNYLVSARNHLSIFNTELSNSGFLNRANDYYYTNTINSISSSLTNVQVDTGSVRDNGNTIVSLVTEYEAERYTGETATVMMDDVSAEDIAETTGAETGDVEGETTVWDSILGFFCEVGSEIWNFIEGCAATFFDLVSSLLQGLGELLEGIVDAAVLLGGTLVAWCASAINFVFGTEIDVDSIKNWSQSFVATRWVENAFNSFYENTGFGSWMANNSILYGTAVKEILVGTAKWIGIVGIGAVITCLTGGAALAPYCALVAGVYGLGSGAELGYNYGLGYYGGLGVGVLKGGVDAVIGYCMGNSFQGAYDAFVSGGSESVTATTVANGVGDQMINPDGTVAAVWDGTAWVAPEAFAGAGSTSTALAVIGEESTALVPYAASTAIGPYVGAGVAEVILPAVVEGATVPAIGAGIAGIIGAGVAEAAIEHGHPTGTGTLSGTNPSADVPPAGPTRIDDDDDEDDVVDPGTIEQVPTSTSTDENEELGITEQVPTSTLTDEDEEPSAIEPSGGYGPSYVNPGSGENAPYVDPGSGGNPQYTDPSIIEQPQPTATETPQPTATEEPEPTTTETPQTTEHDTTEDREPNVTFVNVGPEAINVTPTGYKYDYQPTYDGGASGSSLAYVDPGQSSTPEYTAPEVTEEPVYTFESMTPTVESPDLPDIEVDASLRNGNGLETVSNNVQMQSIEVTPLSDITANVNPRAETMVLNDFGGATTLDPSALGMGGVAVGAGIATAYGANKERSEKRKSEEDDEKNENEGFNQ